MCLLGNRLRAALVVSDDGIDSDVLVPSMNMQCCPKADTIWTTHGWPTALIFVRWWSQLARRSPFWLTHHDYIALHVTVGDSGLGGRTALLSWMPPTDVIGHPYRDPAVLLYVHTPRLVWMFCMNIHLSSQTLWREPLRVELAVVTLPFRTSTRLRKMPTARRGWMPSLPSPSSIAFLFRW